MVDQLSRCNEVCHVCDRASQLGHYYTGRDLPQMVVDREFRSDLYYRLNVFPVRLLALRDAGTAILLVSADLDEIRALADRILVMEGGRIAGALDSAASERELGLLMGGGVAR